MGAGKLILVNQPRCLPVQHFAIEDGTFVCGRSTDCDLVLPNVTVSRRHAELRVAGDEIEIVDLASRNGTFVDGVRIERAFLHLGEELRLGEVSFVLSDVRSDEDFGDRFDSVSTRRLPSPGNELPMSDLSPTQRHVLGLLLDGLAEKEIAKALGISTHTAHNHVRNIYSVLGTHSRAELLAHFVSKADGGVTRIHSRRSRADREHH